MSYDCRQPQFWVLPIWQNPDADMEVAEVCEVVDVLVVEALLSNCLAGESQEVAVEGQPFLLAFYARHSPFPEHIPSARSACHFSLCNLRCFPLSVAELTS